MQTLHDVEPDRRAAVALDEVVASRLQWEREREHRRPRALTAREALEALRFEALLITVALLNHANGVDLTEEDYDRITLAQSRIEAIYDEATR